MNKSERLNDMILYLNDKNTFNLKDLMTKYNISKSTALRDVVSLEKIGMPIYSEHGRNGYYGILQNRLLSPIIFTMNEVFALYFSMLTLRAYESTPFHLSIEKLKKKFEKCLSVEKNERLNKMEKVLDLASIQHNNECPYLNDILQYAIEENVCHVIYKKKGIDRAYLVQFFHVSSSFGQWYATGYNYESQSTKVFRCDKITSITKANHTSKPMTDFLKPADALFKTKDAIDFEVEIAEGGVDIFYKEHYPSMTLHSENNKHYIRGFYNSGEENFIANYFMGYGTHILSAKPQTLKVHIKDHLMSLVKHFSEM